MLWVCYGAGLYDEDTFAMPDAPVEYASGAAVYAACETLKDLGGKVTDTRVTDTRDGHTHTHHERTRTPGSPHVERHA